MLATGAPDFSGLDPETGEPWDPGKVAGLLGFSAFDSAELEAVCARVITEHPEDAAAFRAGKKKAIGSLVKAVLDATNKGADARKASEILGRLLA